jgi:hypothetical protein
MRRRAFVTTALALYLLTIFDGTVDAIGHDCDRVAAIAAIVTDSVHTCSPGQCATLKAISRDRDAAVPLRTLAAIVLRVDHRPRFDDRERLRTLQHGSHPTSVRLLARAVEHLVHVPAAVDRAELVELLADRHSSGAHCSSIP